MMPTTKGTSPGTRGAETMLVCLEGQRVLDPDGLILAELKEDGRWYTALGERCHGLVIPAPRAQPQVEPAERDATQRAVDSAWMEHAVEAIKRLVATRETITGDEVWAEIQMPPRESRMIGNALRRAHTLGLVEPTEEHRRSQRKHHNHSRPVRVWRCLHTHQQQFC